MRPRVVAIGLVLLGTASALLIEVACNSVAHSLHSGNTIINIRRDTSFGIPLGSVHSTGISQIVWGYASSGTSLTITLKRDGSTISVRNGIADQGSSYSVSMDRFIEDGDIVLVSDGVTERTIEVPDMTYYVNTVSRIITGTAPASITTTTWGSPHSLQISIGGATRQITTTVNGEFIADFSDRPYLAGLVGAMHYRTPEGDNVYKPIFAVEPFSRGKLGDGWADVVLGKPDFSEIVFNEVTGKRLFNPQGVFLDRSAQPNRLYVYDAGNSRVLGLSHLGVCRSGGEAGNNCTSDSDCPGSMCQIEADRSADIVLGQSSFSSSACNGDSGYQMYPDVPLANAETFCGLREEQMSVSEGGSGATMATDPQGNLYVPDFFNNRILRYDNPFINDRVADYVWGQVDFAGIFCNQGAGDIGPNSTSLCLAPPPGNGDLRAGVAIDTGGYLWVTDSRNNRVLRFPNLGNGVPSQEANLVLGQPNFNTVASGSGLNQMHNPASIQVTDDGAVYVADSLGDRVLVFIPPFSNGMNATRILAGDIQRPTGLGLDSDGGLWVNDNGHDRFVHYVNETPQEIITGVDEEGGLGVDRDGNVYSAGWMHQEVRRHSAPGYSIGSVVFGQNSSGIANATTSRSLYGGHGLEIAGGQLIHGDESRLLFWNNPWNLSNYQAADGIIGAPDFETRDRWGQRFQRMRADDQGRLWVLFKNNSSVTSILGYQLPLTSGASPTTTISAPLPVLGGGEFTWSSDFFLGGIDVQADCDCLWLSDEGYNRVFRIRNASTQPVVDVILGQLSLSETECNQGRGRNYPAADSLCHPGALAFDTEGNLYVADHNLEFDGNLRLLEWDVGILPTSPSSAVFGIPATRVFGRNGNFTEPNCLSSWQDPMCGPWEPAFDTLELMVIGFNGYLGPRFPMIYQNPLTNPYPITALGDFHSMPLSARFDQLGNLYVIDHNRSRILIYRNRQPF
ncbi:MAG: NHL repeat-containing protein [Chloroflexi bacterium]|nr:NHL repeat-containing protein [Chloroflexota bacterium]